MGGIGGHRSQVERIVADLGLPERCEQIGEKCGRNGRACTAVHIPNFRYDRTCAPFSGWPYVNLW